MITFSKGKITYNSTPVTVYSYGAHVMQPVTYLVPRLTYECVVREHCSFNSYCTSIESGLFSRKLDGMSFRLVNYIMSMSRLSSAYVAGSVDMISVLPGENISRMIKPPLRTSLLF